MTTSIPLPLPSDPAALAGGGESGPASANSRLGAFAAVLGSGTPAGAAPGSFDQLLDAPSAAGAINVALNFPLGVFASTPGALPTGNESGPGGAIPAVESETPPGLPLGQSAPPASQIPLGRGTLFVRGRIVSSEIDEAGPAPETTPPGVKDTPGGEKRWENQRDLIEAAAALLATLWPVLPPASPPPADPALSGEGGTPGGDLAENLSSVELSAPGPASSGPVVVIKLADQPAFRLSLPSLKIEADAPLGQILAQTRALITERLADLPENIEARVAGAVSASKVSERLAPAESAESEAPAIELELELPPAPADAIEPEARDRPAETTEPEVANFAVAPRREKPEATDKNYPTEKNFLNPGAERVRINKTNAGIGVAESESDMPETLTAHRSPSDHPVFAGPGAVRETPPLPGALTAPVDPTPTPATRESSLAHRAVETILNVVEAQRSREAEAGVVNLHFKFAGEDLAVRVQLRGGEVHTQFRTDSAELRAALASEWRVVAGQGGEVGVRLIEPVFAGSGASNQSGFGSAPQGQFSSQQHAQQQPQQTPGPAILPGLRALRRDAGRAAAAVETAPRPAVASPTSQHLTAFA
jgi:hypothetical protein